MQLSGSEVSRMHKRDGVGLANKVETLGVDRKPLTIHIGAVQFVHKARNAHRALGSSHHGFAFHLCAPEKNLSSGVAHVSNLCCSPNLPFTTSTSSSSLTLPSTTTQEHAAQSGQHDQLQEHPEHHAHLQALPVDKLRHQGSLWREKPAEWRKPAHDNSHTRSELEDKNKAVGSEGKARSVME